MSLVSSEFFFKKIKISLSGNIKITPQNMLQSLFTNKVKMKYTKIHLILLNNNKLQDFLNRNERTPECFTVNVRKKNSVIPTFMIYKPEIYMAILKYSNYIL